jgi:hypothetical protein
VKDPYPWGVNHLRKRRGSFRIFPHVSRSACGSESVPCGACVERMVLQWMKGPCMLDSSVSVRTQTIARNNNTLNRYLVSLWGVRAGGSLVPCW